MQRSPPHHARRTLAAACVALSLASSACRRQEPQESVPSPAPIAGSAAGARADAGSAEAVGPATGSAFTVAATDLPDPRASPLRVVFGGRGAGVAWVAERADGAHVVHDGRTHRAVTAVDQVVLSPDGTRIAYGAQVDGAWRMVVDGEVGVPSSGVENPVFSPDGRHVAYFAVAGETRRLVVDRAEGAERRRSVGEPIFSADSTRVAFADAAGEDLPAELSVSDVALREVTVRASGVEELVANEQRTRIAAVVREGTVERVVLLGFSRDGTVTRGRPYDAVSSLAFGPDGATVAYVAEKGARRLLVLGEKEAPLPEGAVSGPPVVRPDGAGVGVIVASGDGQLLHEAFVAPGEGSGQRYEEAADLVYAADGRSTAYCARRGEAWFVVANGKEGPPFDRVVTPSFSPDGTLLVYRARKDGRRFVVVADASGATLRRHPAYEQVFPVRFVAGGKSIAYGVKDGRQVAWKVVPP